jgi:hypothetical protein
MEESDGIVQCVREEKGRKERREEGGEGGKKEGIEGQK